MLVGDGYRGKTSPHTPNEKFEGATVLKALKVKSSFGFGFPSVNLGLSMSGRHRKENLEYSLFRTVKGSKYELGPTLLLILLSFLHSVINLPNSMFPKFVFDR